MKLVTWNVNGLRSLDKPIATLLSDLEADILCVQETKLSSSANLDSSLALIAGFSSFFSCCRTAKTGYSGVAIYCRDSMTPENAEQGLSGILNSHNADDCDFLECLELSSEEIKALDYEGRAILTWHQFKTNNSDEKMTLCVINVYCPRFDPDRPERWDYKMNFYRLLQSRAERLLAGSCHVILCGDFNVSAQKIDSCDPEPYFDEQEHRLWLNNELLFDSEKNPRGKFVDLYRYFHTAQQRAYTCWNQKTSARQNNYGTRIDYIIADTEFVAKGLISDCKILSDVMGSDHCPVVVEFSADIIFIPASVLPSLCSKFLPQFRGTQKRLTSFVTVKEQSTASVSEKRPKTVPKSNAQPSIHAFFDAVKTKPAKTSAILDKAHTALPVTKNSQKLSKAWSEVFSLPKAPLCKGHNKDCLLRTVKKDGPNVGRKFWVCSFPDGHKGEKNAKCDHFEWKVK